MAIVQTSALISDIKGSINGSTFQRANGGLVMRNKPYNIAVQTELQNETKYINNLINNAWLNLTDAERNTWLQYSNFINGIGKTKNLKSSANTGKTQFYSVNFYLYKYGKPFLLVPTFAMPLQPLRPCPPFFTQSSNLGNYVGELDTSKQILITKVSLAQSVATNTNNTGYRLLVYNQINGSQQNWFDAYKLQFGKFPEYNYKYWISLQVLDFTTGQFSPISEQLVLYKEGLSTGVGFMIVGSTNIVG